MRRIFFYSLLFCCCFQHQPLFCQVIENRFTHYTTKDGLPDGFISDIKQDKPGFLWLATSNGLCRFDGHDFKIFRRNPQDTNSLCENPIRNIFIDADDHLWGVSLNWLYLYHPHGGWFEHFNMDGFGAEKICGEENGQLIIASAIKGLYKFDIANKSFLKIGREATPLRYYDYKKDENGVEWMSKGSNLVRYDPNTKKQDTISYGLEPFIILPGGFLITGTFDQGLLLINRKTNETKYFLPNKKDPNAILNESITCLYQLNDSTVLVGTIAGLSVFNLKTGIFTNIAPEQTNPASLSDANTRIRSIFCDREGILWVGGDHLEKQDFKNFNIKIIPYYGKEHNQKRFDHFTYLFPCADGKFLLGSYGGMSIYDPVKDNLQKMWAKQFNPAKNEKYKLIDCIHHDEHGNYWCINWPEFCSFNIKDDQAVNIHERIFPISFRIGDMEIDKRDRVLIATIGKGMMRFDPADNSYTFFDTSSRSPVRLSNLNIGVICVANDGNIWLGTSKGITKIGNDDKTGKQFSRGKIRNGSLKDFNVTDIKEDSKGMIWFATTEDGIGRIDPATDSISFLSIAQGLPTCRYDKICIDDNNNLWAMSKMGILRINTATLQNQLYTGNEGFPLPDDIIDIQYSKFTGKLYILTNYAIFEINTAHANYTPRVPETLITGLSVFDNEKPLPQNNTLNLKYNENFINIQFAALLFHSNEQIKYAYKMDGIDQDWNYCNFKRNASYTNLPPGQYTFRVRSQSPAGIWSNTPTILNINIRPPFWLTWWFYLLETALVSAIILWILRLYTTRKLAKQKIEFEKQQAVLIERTRIASDMHDEMGAGLTSISLLSEVATRKIKQNISANTEIQKIVRSADALSKNLSEIIWTMNTGNDKLEDFIIYIRTYAVEYFDDTPIMFTFNCPDDIPELNMAGELRRNIFLCIKEALNNIIKHAQSTEASLTFGVIGNTLITTIADNGVGIDTKKVNKFGNGLNNMKDRLKKSGGDLKIEVNNGTKLVFTININ